MKKYTIALALSALAGSAMAGFSYGPTDIVINSSNRSAVGGVNMARRTADNTQYIACSTSKNLMNPQGGSCFARDKYGTIVNCVTMDADIIATMRSVTSSSYISFTWTTTGQCQYVGVSTGSLYDN